MLRKIAFFATLAFAQVVASAVPQASRSATISVNGVNGPFVKVEVNLAEPSGAIRKIVDAVVTVKHEKGEEILPSQVKLIAGKDAATSIEYNGTNAQTFMNMVHESDDNVGLLIRETEEALNRELDGEYAPYYGDPGVQITPNKYPGLSINIDGVPKQDGKKVSGYIKECNSEIRIYLGEAPNVHSIYFMPREIPVEKRAAVMLLILDIFDRIAKNPPAADVPDVGQIDLEGAYKLTIGPRSVALKKKESNVFDLGIIRFLQSSKLETFRQFHGVVLNAFTHIARILSK